MKMRLHKKISRLLRRKIRTSVMSQYGEGILARTKNGLFIVEAGDFSVGRKLLDKGSYDFECIEWLKLCIGSDATTIVIVGTHIGTLLIPLAQACTHIIGYEADSTNFKLLSLNLALNHVDNANVHLVAIGAHAQKVQVQRNILNTGNTSVKTGHIAENTINKTIEMITLDESIEQDAIDLMIMDIEGHELHALKGGIACLKKTSKLYIEFAPEQLVEHGTQPTEVLELLAKEFKYLYILSDTVHAYTVKEGTQHIIQEMHEKSYLKNLLYCKEELSDPACAFKA